MWVDRSPAGNIRSGEQALFICVARHSSRRIKDQEMTNIVGLTRTDFGGHLPLVQMQFATGVSPILNVGSEFYSEHWGTPHPSGR